MKEYIVPVGDKGNMNMIENELHLQQLIRCKDCRHCTFSDGEQLADCMIKQGWFPVKPDWFCADGERRTDNV